MVEFPFYLGKHLICQLAEVCAFRDVLAYQPYYAILDPVTEEQKAPSRGYDLDVEAFVI